MSAPTPPSPSEEVGNPPLNFPWDEIFPVWFKGQAATPRIIEAVLRSMKALVSGHIIASNWQHTSEYLDKGTLRRSKRLLHFLAHQCALKVRNFEDLTCVAGPVHGTTDLSSRVADYLGHFLVHPVTGIYLTETEGGYTVPAEFINDVQGKLVFLVVDVVFSGDNLRRCFDALLRAGGTVVAVGCIVDRHGTLASEPWENIEEFALLTTLDVKVYGNEEDCLLCQDGIPVRTDVGHGREFLISLHERNPALANRLGYKELRLTRADRDRKPLAG